MSQTDNVNQEVDWKIEKLKGRQRRILAQIQIFCPSNLVWQILTNYDALAEFIPNMVQSRRLEFPEGVIGLEQTNVKTIMGIKRSFRSVYEIEEKFPGEIRYKQVEGEVKECYGLWRLEDGKSSEEKAGVRLIYDFVFLPQPIHPMALFETFVKQEVVATMVAIRQQAETIFNSSSNAEIQDLSLIS